ncbi:hypothetical protein NK983_30265, partial [Salmonella enterica subsp. enterica serovar Typhimurium]|nr:hypothetical protein [Salmonella enterica subsp. enterica serovar Typhimurium]
EGGQQPQRGDTEQCRQCAAQQWCARRCGFGVAAVHGGCTDCAGAEPTRRGRAGMAVPSGNRRVRQLPSSPIADCV